MGLSELKNEREKYLEKEGASALSTQVFNVFLRQPLLIGNGIANLRPINFANPSDISSFLNSTKRDLQYLLDDIGIYSEEDAMNYFKNAVELLLKF